MVFGLQPQDLGVSGTIWNLNYFGLITGGRKETGNFSMGCLGAIKKWDNLHVSSRASKAFLDFQDYQATQGCR